MHVPTGHAIVRHKFALSADFSQYAYFTHGVVDNGASNAAALASYAATAMTQVGGLGAANKIIVGWTYQQCEVSYMTALGFVNATAVANVTGTLAGNPCPINCAVLVTKQTAVGGRQGRGRMYMPPAHVDEANVSPGGSIAGPQQTAIQAEVDLYRNNFEGSDPWTFMLLHNDPSLSPYLVVQLLVQTKMATQRRRLRR